MSFLRYSLLALAASAMAAGATYAQTASQPPPHEPPARGLAKPVSDADLQGLSGGQAIAVNEQQLKAITSDNSVNALGSISNGPVNLSANAFSGFSGLGNFVINTGNNNTLQGSMSVNITMTPAP
ncbi:MAG: hypothetical protein ACXU82_14655 [Caulobacteraceae bacterium]